MKTTTQILPGIKKIYYVDSAKLPFRVDLANICGMDIVILDDLVEVEFFGDPDCSCTSKQENKAITQEAKLEFNSPVRLPQDIRPSFVVTDVNDNDFLIGSREMPLPKVNCTYSAAVPGSSRAGFKYEITHNAIRTMIPCIS